MSISINAFNELWGLISCHTYGTRGQRVSFPIRKMCRLVGDAASRNIERLSYASRLQARKLINTAPTQSSPSGYIVASSDDLLSLFDADFGVLSIHDETKILGHLAQASQEALALLEYLRMRRITSVTTSQDIMQDFPDLRYPPGFQVISGMLVVPLSEGGRDFIVFFRKGQLKEVKWAGNPYEKFVREGTEGYLEPRRSFKVWRETVVGKSREWTEEEVETAAVLCLVYGKFIDVWRQKEAALQNSQLTRLLLANSAHEVRTPLNAIINYLEIALEGQLDQETRDNLTKSHSASKSLIYVINDLLDLTKTEEGGSLIKGEIFNLKETLKEATDMFAGDAKRKNLAYKVIEHPGVPQRCIGDQGRVRQAISNIIVNAIQHTTEGSITVEMYVASWPEPNFVEVEVAVTDTGKGMNAEKLDQLFNQLEQVQSESEAADFFDTPKDTPQRQLTEKKEEGSLGLGLALVSRIIRNMNGQLRLKSEEGKGSRFVIQFPFDLPSSETEQQSSHSSEDTTTPQPPETPQGERTLVARTPSRTGSIASDEKRPHNRSSMNSINSRSSTGAHSFNSGSSGKSDVDRMIETIQAPHRLYDDRNSFSGSSKSMRPMLTKRNSHGPQLSSPCLARSKSLELPAPAEKVPEHQRELASSVHGEQQLPFSVTPLKPIKVPDDVASSVVEQQKPGFVEEIEEEPKEEPVSTQHMRVLVAEDDPVNSRIIKKRLEKIGHTVTLTVNGEECAAAFGETPRDFDVVLMDMQMPIVDGLTSTKLIRSYEKTHSNILSPRAKICGRVPIIAVSASLEEKNMQMYVDVGFDAWILKPIAFDRLSEILIGIVDIDMRKDWLYKKGEWERGGWFHCINSFKTADTAPSGENPHDGLSKMEKPTSPKSSRDDDK
jgi:signal transduction histidine kinase/CheY-like chemotaxis protein